MRCIITPARIMRFMKKLFAENVHPVLPEVEKLKGMPVLCFCGEKESDSLCKDLGPNLAKTISLPGGHHFGGKYDFIADAILRNIAGR